MDSLKQWLQSAKNVDKALVILVPIALICSLEVFVIDPIALLKIYLAVFVMLISCILIDVFSDWIDR